MSTEKRDHLANCTRLVLPPAVKDIERAIEIVESGKVQLGVALIYEALTRIKVMGPIAEEACAEGGVEAN